MTTGRTTNLDLALPVEGELTGQWGDMVNNGITKYLDIAVAGTQTISGSQTAVTLTSTEGDDTADNIAQVGSGATGSSQYMIINCTGNPASLLTITAPATSKMYVVINATSTSQSVKIVGTGPTTGVTLLAGEKAVVAWNGSDFVKIASTQIEGYTTGSTTYNVVIGSEAGSALTSGNDQNTFVGGRAGRFATTGLRNTAIGAFALDAVTTTSYNTAVGAQAATDTTGSNVTAIGASALRSLTTGGGTAVGANALYSVTTASGNVAFGASSGYNTTGANNTYIGSSAGYSSTTGASNCAVGATALYGDVNPQRSCAFGFEAAYTVSSNGKSDNVAIGYQAARTISCNASVIIGTGAGYVGGAGFTGDTNNVILGYNASASGSLAQNEITLGNGSIATLRCQVTTITGLSDARDKANIRNLDAGLDFVKTLRPVAFDWNTRDGAKVGDPDTGFLAQDLQAAQQVAGVNIPGLVYDVNPEKLEAGYGKLIPVLVKAVQELAAEVERLKRGG